MAIRTIGSKNVDTYIGVEDDGGRVIVRTYDANGKPIPTGNIAVIDKQGITLCEGIGCKVDFELDSLRRIKLINY